jgi:hypothetical protein
MVDDGSVKSVVDMLVRRGGYIDNGTLESELEQLFPSEERNGQCRWIA